MKISAILIKINTAIEKVCSFSLYPNLLNGSIDFTVLPAKKPDLCIFLSWKLLIKN